MGQHRLRNYADRKNSPTETHGILCTRLEKLVWVRDIRRTSSITDLNAVLSGCTLTSILSPQDTMWVKETLLSFNLKSDYCSRRKGCAICWLGDITSTTDLESWAVELEHLHHGRHHQTPNPTYFVRRTCFTHQELAKEPRRSKQVETENKVCTVMLGLMYTDCDTSVKHDEHGIITTVKFKEYKIHTYKLFLSDIPNHPYLHSRCVRCPYVFGNMIRYALSSWLKSMILELHW